MGAKQRQRPMGYIVICEGAPCVFERYASFGALTPILWRAGRVAHVFTDLRAARNAIRRTEALARRKGFPNDGVWFSHQVVALKAPITT